MKGKSSVCYQFYEIVYHCSNLGDFIFFLVSDY